MLSFFLGIAGMLLVIGSFFSGVWFAMRFMAKSSSRIVTEDTEGKTPEEIEMERKRLIEENDAFKQMQKYTMETAYCIESEEDELI